MFFGKKKKRGGGGGGAEDALFDSPDSPNNHVTPQPYNIVLMGHIPLSKATLLETLYDDKPPSSYKAFHRCVHFRRRELKVSKDSTVRLNLWDITWKKGIVNIATQYCRGIHGVILYYDTTNTKAFEDMKSFVKTNAKTISSMKIPIHIVGVSWNKSDESTVPQKEVIVLSNTIGTKVSSCTLDNEESVNKVFCSLITDINKKCKIDFSYEGNGGNNDLPPKPPLPPPRPPSSSSSLSSPSSSEQQKEFDANKSDKPDEKSPAPLISICKYEGQKSNAEVQRNETGLFGNYHPDHIYGYLSYNVSVLGNPRIGKSCLCARYLEDSGSGEVNETNTLWVSSFTLPNKKFLRLRMIEGTLPLSGSDPRLETHYSHSHAILLCYDTTDRASFDAVKGAAAEVRVSAMRGAVIMVVGLRYDAEKKYVSVSGSEGKTLADSHGMHFRECSGKDNVGVRELFTKILFELQKIDSFALPIYIDDANRIIPLSTSSDKEHEISQPPSLLEQITSKQIKKMKEDNEYEMSNPKGIEHDYLFKIVVVGYSGSGVTFLINRFVDDTFSDYRQNKHIIGEDFRIKSIYAYDNKVIKLQIWDASSLIERYKYGGGSFYRGTKVFIVCFDTTNKESLESVQQWMGEIDRYAPENADVIIAGLKCDLPPIVDLAAAQELADLVGRPLMYCSSKTGEGVDEVFEEAATIAMDRIEINTK